MTLGKGMAALVAAMVATAVPEVHAWEQYLGTQRASLDGIVVGDLDLNGKAEAVVTCGRDSQYSYCSSNLMALLDADSTGRLDVRSVIMLPVTTMGPPIIWSRPAYVDRVIVPVETSTADAQVLVMGGIPLQVLKTIPTPMLQRVIAIADVDADGEPEIVALTSQGRWSPSYPSILDYQTGAVKWVSPTAANDVVVGQFDADAALELVVASTPGQVIDGATHAVEWSYAGGFGYRLLAGRFGAGEKMGFAAFPTSNRIQIFQSQPYSPISEIVPPSSVTTAAVIRMTPGGADQIAVGNEYGSNSVTIFDPRSGTTLYKINDRDDIAAIGAGDLDGDGRIELVYGGRSLTGSVDYLKAVDLGSSATDYFREVAYGPFSSLARGDLEGSGGRQIALLNPGSRYSSPGLAVSVLDNDTGAILRSRASVTGDSYSGRSPRVAVGQLDADAQEEIVIASDEYYDAVVVAIDGRTLAEQWRVGPGTSGRPLGSYTPNGLGLVDVDADGKADVVVGTDDGRIVVLNGRNGAVLWTSITLPGYQPSALEVFRTEAGSPRAVVSRGTGLYLFDLASHLLVASVNVAGNVSAVRQWGGGAACRIAAMDEAAVVTLHRCDTLAMVGQQLLPEGSIFFRPLDAGGNHLLAAANGYLHEVGGDGRAAIVSKPLGRIVGTGNQGVVDIGPAGRADVVIGSDYMVTRIQVTSDKLFADGFD